MKMLEFCHKYAKLLWVSFHNVAKICKPVEDYQFYYIEILYECLGFIEFIKHFEEKRYMQGFDEHFIS